MDARERAELIKEATFDDWMRRPKGKTFLDKERDNLRLEIRKAPDFIYDKGGGVVGVDAWVRLFEGDKELRIDPHRRIVNPPTVPRSGVRRVEDGVDEKGKPKFRREIIQDPVEAFYEAVWDSVIDTPNEKGWRTRGTVTTVFGISGDGYIRSGGGGATYTQARNGINLMVNDSFFGSGNIVPGQEPNNDFVMLGYFGFDTSSIADGDVVSAAVVDLWLVGDSSDVDFTIDVRQTNWSPTLATTDFVGGDSLSSLTLLASLSTSGIGATGAYKTFTSQPAMLTATSLKTGVVDMLCNSSRTIANNNPGGGNDEYVTFSGSAASGTTQDPKLTITHEAAPKALQFFTSRPNRIWRLH